MGHPMSILQERLSKGRALMPYLTASDPSPEASLEAALGAVEGGAAALEVGIPFSDPVADGPVIQLAHQRALAAGEAYPTPSISWRSCAGKAPSPRYSSPTLTQCSPTAPTDS